MGSRTVGTWAALTAVLGFFVAAGFYDWLETTELLTLGLLVFGAIQIVVPHDVEQHRRRERERDAEMRDDAAYQVVWAEHFRLDGLADHWGKNDLVYLSALGALDDREVLPRDWTTVMSALVEIGQEAAHLGSVAVTLSHDLARDVAIFNATVAWYKTQFPGWSPQALAEAVTGKEGTTLRTQEGELKKNCRELSYLLWDATLQTERAEIERALSFRTEKMRSDIGKRTVAALQKRSEEAAKKLAKKPS